RAQPQRIISATLGRAPRSHAREQVVRGRATRGRRHAAVVTFAAHRHGAHALEARAGRRAVVLRRTRGARRRVRVRQELRLAASLEASVAPDRAHALEAVDLVAGRRAARHTRGAQHDDDGVTQEAHRTLLTTLTTTRRAPAERRAPRA